MAVQSVNEYVRVRAQIGSTCHTTYILEYRTTLVDSASIISAAIFHVEMKMEKTI